MSDVDPLDADQRVERYFGDSWLRVKQFRDKLAAEGVLRGLIGPREVGRLWERHLINSSAVVPYLTECATVIDIGSGAGLPGIVIAAMRPDMDVTLVESMERRTTWLREVATDLGLTNVTVVRSRAEELHGKMFADAVTARAVGSMDLLYGLAGPLLRVGGRLVVLKGQRAQDEVLAAETARAKSRFAPAKITEQQMLSGVDPTTVVVAHREGKASQ